MNRTTENGSSLSRSEGERVGETGPFSQRGCRAHGAQKVRGNLSPRGTSGERGIQLLTPKPATRTTSLLSPALSSLGGRRGRTLLRFRAWFKLRSPQQSLPGLVRPLERSFHVDWKKPAAERRCRFIRGTMPAQPCAGFVDSTSNQVPLGSRIRKMSGPSPEISIFDSY